MSAAASESCAICLESYNKKRRVVTCQYCPSSACGGCQQRYLLQSFEDPHCMECKRGWSSEFMAANFPLLFRTHSLRRHRRKILLEREKAALPAFQVYVEHKRASDEAWKRQKEVMKVFGSMFYSDKTPTDQIDANTVNGKAEVLHRRMKATTVEMSRLKDLIGALRETISREGSTPERDTELAALRKDRRILKSDWDALNKEFQPVSAQRKEYLTLIGEMTTARWRADAQYNDTWQGGAAEAAATPQKREFIMKCPDDGCRGFLSTAYKCGICAKWTCPDCMVVIGLEKDAVHTCDPNTVESAKAIKSETRPCPKCGTRIFKIDGCDQMWCVMEGCGTAFSWNTGQVVTGRVHNPHYYEWLRRTGGGAAPREAGDIPCGGIPGWYDMRAVWSLNAARDGFDAATHNRMTEIHRHLVELQDMRLTGFPLRAPVRANKDNNVKYLAGEIDEEEWQRGLELTEAAWRRKAEVGQILQMAVAAAGDILRRIADHVRVSTEPGAAGRWIRETGLPDLDALRNFVNDAFKALAKREHIAVPQFGENWKWMPLRALYRAVPQKKAKVEVAVAVTTL